MIERVKDMNEENLTRKKFIRLGAQVAAVAGLVPLFGKTLEAGASSDLQRLDPGLSGLNVILSFKYLMQAFYEQALDTAGFVPELDRPAIEQIEKHENGHVNALKGLLGSAAVALPSFDFSGGGRFNPFGDYGSFVVLAAGLEDFGVKLIQGQLVPYTSNRSTLGTLLEMHSTEARHAAKVREMRGLRPWVAGTPGDAPLLAPIYASESGGATTAALEAFDEPLSQAAASAFISGFFI